MFVIETRLLFAQSVSKVGTREERPVRDGMGRRQGFFFSVPTVPSYNFYRLGHCFDYFPYCLRNNKKYTQLHLTVSYVDPIGLAYFTFAHRARSQRN